MTIEQIATALGLTGLIAFFVGYIAILAANDRAANDRAERTLTGVAIAAGVASVVCLLASIWTYAAGMPA